MGTDETTPFPENLIFATSFKRHFCDFKNLGLGHDLPSSVNDRVIARNHEDFIFTKLRIWDVSGK